MKFDLGSGNSEMNIQWRVKIRRMALALSLIGLIASGNRAYAACGFQQTNDREFHQVYDIAPNGSLGIYNTSGTIDISSWNENRVKIDAVKNGRRVEDLARVEIQVTANSDRLDIRVIYPNGFNWKGGGVSVDFEIKVPRTIAINSVNATSGDVKVSGPIEKLTVRTTSGNITALEITDTASLTASSGNIDARKIGGELRITTSSGELTVSEVNSRLFANASSGSIRASQIAEDVSATVSSGDIRLEKIGGRATARSNSGSINMIDIGGDAQASSLSDNVTLSHIRGRANVNAISGDVNLDNIEQGVRVTSISGSVTVSNSKGRVEVTNTSDNIILNNLDSADVIAKTTSGNVRFSGRIQEDGHYEFESFNGEVLLFFPSDSNFNLSARTHNGSVNTEFPLQITRTAVGGSMSGTVGKGGADIRVSSFNGTVWIKKNAR